MQPKMMWFKKLWHLVRWPLYILLAGYVVLVLYRIPAVSEKQKTAETIANINAQKITMADVLGTNLPPKPYEPENDATVAGIDKNNNGIRDDVELAIFAKYPNSPKIRAAELQYAMTEQMYLTDVFNTDTWKAVSEADSRASDCINRSVPNSGNLSKDLADVQARSKEVENLVFNTQARKASEENAYNYTTSFSLGNGDGCDIDINTL